MKPRARSSTKGLLGFIAVLGWITVLAQPPAGPVQVDFGDAALRVWVRPEYPQAAREAKLEGTVVVEFVVGLDGQVSQATVSESTDPVFNDAALAAVQRWRFDAAIENGKPAASAMKAPVVFQLAQLREKNPPLTPPPALMPSPMGITPPRVVDAPDPDYPDELEAERLPGEVQIEFTVDESGAARAPRVLWASHAAFVEESLRALEKTKFEPARQGPLARRAKMKYPVEFESEGAKRSDILEANHLTLPGENSAGVMPVPFVLPDPVYPFAHLIAAERGAAVGEFDVEPNGRTKNVILISASAPEFGAALRAAIETWMFKPPIDGDTIPPVRMRVTYAFVPPADGAVFRLAAALRPGGAGVTGAAGLDQRLKPLWRGFPVYPMELRDENLKGSAEIEFIIDRDGRARLPQVKSATREEFGWAAATAISQWVFERPTRKGEPADVTVSIPVNFVPPKQ